MGFRKTVNPVFFSRWLPIQENSPESGFLLGMGPSAAKTKETVWSDVPPSVVLPWGPLGLYMSEKGSSVQLSWEPKKLQNQK